jgi:hypothetical protein
MAITTKILGIWFLPFGPSIVLSRKRIQEYSDFKRHFSFKPRHTYLKKEKRAKRLSLPCSLSNSPTVIFYTLLISIRAVNKKL